MEEIKHGSLKDLRKAWTRVPLWLRGSITLAIASLMALIGYLRGRASDCAPDSMDGQCGMSTFYGLVYGVIAALVFVGIVSGVSLFFEYREEKQSPDGE